MQQKRLLIIQINEGTLSNIDLILPQPPLGIVMVNVKESSKIQIAKVTETFLVLLFAVGLKFYTTGVTPSVSTHLFHNH